jgi:suppressor of fused-like protein
VETESDDPEASGWAAIDAALEPLYPGQEPKHWGTVSPAALGGTDHLQGISAYAADGPPHWHFITYGFSELYDEQWSNPDLSGFGFELTFRLKRDGFEEPPSWVFSFLQNLGRYVFSSGNTFEPSHHMDLNGPIAMGVDTAIRAIGFIEDPDLPAIQTPNGHLRFTQIVGLTLDEAAVLRSWDATKFLELLARQIPKSITALDRVSTLVDPSTSEAVRRGIESDGSSTALLYVSTLSWRQEKRLLRPPKTTLVLGANGVRDLGFVLKGRVPFGRSLSILGPKSLIVFEPGSAFAIATDQAEGTPTVRISLSPEGAHELADLVKPQRGTYSHPSFPGLEVVVEPSLIRTPEGEIAETIG